MAIRIIDDTKLQNIAVAIQAKDGGGQMTVDEMPTRIAAIPTQDNTVLNSLIKRTIISIENSEVTIIGDSAFKNCKDLTSASFPNATAIDGDAFASCVNLTSASFPNATRIGLGAFYSCRYLTNASFPNATSIATNAFYGCRYLTSASFPNATSIGPNAFYNCHNLTSASFPNATSIGSNAFYGCTPLSTLILGKRATLSSSDAFSGANKVIIYVQPEDLTWYSTATNWSALYTAGRVKSIEELPT